MRQFAHALSMQQHEKSIVFPYKTTLSALLFILKMEKPFHGGIFNLEWCRNASGRDGT